MAIFITSSCKKDDNDNDNEGINNSQKEWLNQNLDYGTVTDQDGNSYATIQIGNQTWMAENLRTSTYCNGDTIPNVTDNLAWENLTNGAWSHYDNNSQYEIPYGKLYNWYAVDDSRNICPCGWHVPSHEEWKVLTDSLGESVAGGKMKSTGTQFWESPNTDATNESGFSGLPGGFRNIRGSFHNVGESSFWWSSESSLWRPPTTYGLEWFLSMYNLSGSVSDSYSNKKKGLSVRCIKD